MKYVQAMERLNKLWTIYERNNRKIKKIKIKGVDTKKKVINNDAINSMTYYRKMIYSHGHFDRKEGMIYLDIIKFCKTIAKLKVLWLDGSIII